MELLFRSCCYRADVAFVWELLLWSLLWIYCFGNVVWDMLLESYSEELLLKRCCCEGCGAIREKLLVDVGKLLLGAVVQSS